MIRAILVLLGAGFGARLLSWLIVRALRRVVKDRRAEGSWRTVERNCERSVIAVSMAAAIYFALPLTKLPPKPLGQLRQWLLVVLIGTLAWFVVKTLHAAEELLFEYSAVKEPRDQRARRKRTQIQIVRRLTGSIVVLLALGAMLMTFDPVRKVGLSMLASAGVIGLVLSIAAQPVLSGAMAGTQLAFTGGLRVEDVVVVNGEWGRVEQLQLSYVVVKMWDGRRLILPTNYFTSNPYQNWTRFETRVLGSVELPVDYTVDLDTLRSEAQRLIEASPLWDRSEWQLQMVDVTPQAVMVRITVSAADGPSAWDLRCEVREAMVRFLRDQHPHWLPRGRSAYQP